ncbi:MAG TPA: hemerythrin domain-containing protein [Gammaproteobacteria bacterium]|nr:hemerythrin domain-containing protein [Gammaproteobacteria bacterium]
MLEKLFRKQTPKAEAPKLGQAPARDLPYEPGLVAAFTQQHRDLVMLLLKANSAAQQDRYEEVKDALERFKNGLNEHLTQENLKLHPYIGAHLKGENSKDVLRDMRHNSARIQGAVDGLISHYLGYPVSGVNVERFEMEIAGVIEEFSQELETEEASFYTLYQSPGSY